MTRIAAGAILPSRTLTSIAGKAVDIPNARNLVHLQFRRYAGCPICNTHLRSISSRIGEIEAAGVREIVVFHSPAEELLKYRADLPFDVVGDPERALYREFGVSSSPRALTHPKAIAASMRGLVTANPLGALGVGEDHIGLPADFLIEPDGVVRAAKYGKHAYDQWSVDELLAHTR